MKIYSSVKPTHCQKTPKIKLLLKMLNPLIDTVNECKGSVKIYNPKKQELVNRLLKCRGHDLCALCALVALISF